MKKLLALLFISCLVQTMEPVFKPTPSLGGLPPELKNTILSKIIEIPKDVLVRDIESAARNLKSFLLTNKQFAALANENTINEIIVAFTNNWWPGHFDEAASLLLKRQSFEKNNIVLSNHINKLITKWKQSYREFRNNVLTNNWPAVKFALKTALPIEEVANAITFSSKLSPEEKKMKFNKLIEAGADAQEIEKLLKTRLHFF